MHSRRRQQQPPLQTATRFFVLGVLALVGAIVFPLISVSCSYDGPVELCFETTFYGLDAHTFAIVLGVICVLCFAGGVFYLMRHKQTLTAQRNGAVYSVSQPFASQQPAAYPPFQQQEVYPPIQQTGVYPPVQQPAAYPPAQNATFPGSYTGDVPSQPPSNTFPRL